MQKQGTVDTDTLHNIERSYRRVLIVYPIPWRSTYTDQNVPFMSKMSWKLLKMGMRSRTAYWCHPQELRNINKNVNVAGNMMADVANHTVTTWASRDTVTVKQ